ncbi:MAG: peptidyl-prolyl cis-trans isomerase [Pseudomonadota bacterium]|nr:peptidyl-prolyl cis-trans isomerase [Pseudomonadota bacterium]
MSTVLSIGDRAWTSQTFAWLLEAGGASGAKDPALLHTFVNAMAKNRALAKQAEQDGVDADPRVMNRLAVARDRILAEEEASRLRRLAPVDALTVRARFDAEPHAYDELRLSQILVRVNGNSQTFSSGKRRTAKQALARARSIRQQLQRGADFASLARKFSDDESSRDSGGELPTIFQQDLRDDLAANVLALTPGEVGPPVLGSDGYHLIRLEEKSTATFEGSRRLLEFNLREAWAEQRLKQLSNSMPVSFNMDGWLAERDRLAGGK